jgi:outer membrane phospholipase A
LFFFSVALVPLTAEAGEPVPDEAAQVAEASEQSAEPQQSAEEQLEQLRRDYLPYGFNLYPYKPIYFAGGTDLAESKFQLSFRYQFVREDGELAQRRPWARGFNLAFTQTSGWDLKSESKPFKDTSYKPEFFYRSPYIPLGLSWAPGLQMQTGFRHESNGRDGADSRSTNFIYGKFTWLLKLSEEMAVLVAPEAFVYVGNEDETNPDLDAYRGHFDLELRIARKDSFSLATNYMHGSKGWSVRTEFTYPMHHFLRGNLNVYFFAQRFDGYADNLLDYTEKTHATRFGIALAR